MGLQVLVYEGVFGTSNWEILDSEAGDYLAGPESSRTELWGSSIVKTTGLKLLPKLSNENLYLSGEKLNDLEEEVKVVQANVGEMALETHYDEYSIMAITNNILKAIDRAKQINGGVLIW